VRDAAHRSGDAPAATNKVEAFNGFSEWVRFGNSGVLADNEPIEQEKALKFNSVLTNAIILHNTLDIADVVRQLQADGEAVAPEDLARISPLLHRAQHALRRVLNP
jgi:TnpA family transposase